MAPHMNKTRPSVEDVDEPHLTVSGAARRLGIAPATLRTWDRRYGIGPTDHAHGRHRRYSSDDMARLELDAARAHAGRRPGGGGPLRPQRRLAVGRAGRRRRRTPRRSPRSRPRPRRRPSPSAPRRRAGAAQPGRRGRHAADAGAGPRARGLGRAALALDAVAMHSLVEESIAADGVAATWDDVARPVLVAVGERWATTGRGVEIEHLLSQCLIAVFAARASAHGAAARPSGAARGDAVGPARRCRSPCSRAAARRSGRSGCRSLGSRPARRRPRRGRAPDSARRRRALVADPLDRGRLGRHRTAGHPAALPGIRGGPRLGRRRPAAGRGGARLARRGGRADRCGRAASSRPFASVERTSPCAADEVAQRVVARCRTGRPGEDRLAVGSPRRTTSSGAVAPDASA